MKIAVLIKQTPDTEVNIELTSDQTKIDPTNMKFIINPYDEFGIEEALKLKEQSGQGEILLLCFGPDSARERLLKGLAMGADRAVLISSEGHDLDSYGISQVLAHALQQEKPDLVFCGKQAIDDDNMHVGPMVAEFLSWPHVNVVTKVTLSGGSCEVLREVEGGQVESYQVELPAVLGAHKSLNSPRYASLPGIMKAKKKPFDTKTLSDLGITPPAATTIIKNYVYPKAKPKGQIFKDQSVQDMVSQVVTLLRDQAKVL